MDFIPRIFPDRRNDTSLSSGLRRFELILLLIVAAYFWVASVWSNFAITLVKKGDQKEVSSLNPNNPELYYGEWLYSIYSHVYGPVFEPIRPHVPHGGLIRYEWTGRRWICFDLVAMGLMLISHYGIVLSFSGIHRSLGLQLPRVSPLSERLAELAQDYNSQLDRAEHDVRTAIDEGRLEELIAIQPTEKDEISAYRIALAYTVLGDPVNAHEWITQAREWAPAWGGRKHDARMVGLIGHVAARMDDVPGAITAYSQANKFRGETGQSLFAVSELGYAYAVWALRHQQSEVALQALSWVRLIVSLEGTGDLLRSVAERQIELLTRHGLDTQAAAVQAEYIARPAA